MAMTSVGDLLDRARTFECTLEEYYKRLRDETAHEGVRLLTYYLARHRNHLSEGLRDIPAEQVSRVSKVSLKHDIGFDPWHAAGLEGMDTKTVDGTALLNAAVAYDCALINLYRQVLQQPLSSEAKEVVEALIRIEEKDIVMLKKIQAMNYF